MNLLLKTLSWIGGVALLLLGLLMMFGMPAGGLLLVLAGLFLLPPIRTYAFNITKKQLTVQARAITVTSLIIAAILAFGVGGQRDAEAKKMEEAKQLAAAEAEALQKTVDEFTANRDSILSKAKANLSIGKFEEVRGQLKQYVAVKDEELQQILSSATAGLELQEKKAQEASLLDEAKKATDDSRLVEIYSKLASLFPDNKKYLEQRTRYAEAVEKEAEKVAAETARKKLIEHQFSGWDGAHINLERVIKKSMNDPDSYEHDETKYWDRGDHLVVQTQFRGRNSFGGMVRNTVKAKVDMDGNIIEVMDQY